VRDALSQLSEYRMQLRHLGKACIHAIAVFTHKISEYHIEYLGTANIFVVWKNEKGEFVGTEETKQVIECFDNGECDPDRVSEYVWTRARSTHQVNSI
jgi:hypothetical protein